MIEIDVTELEEEAHKQINMICGSKQEEIRKEMIKFLKESHWENSFEYASILEFLNDFFISKLNITPS